MKDEQLTYELTRWMVCQITADCFRLISDPPVGFLGIPLNSQIWYLQWKHLSTLPWSPQDITEILEILDEAKAIIANHRPLVSCYSKVTFQHGQRAEKLLEQVNFLKALDLISKWEISQWTNFGYIEMGFLSMQVAKEALLTIFSTPKYYSAAKPQLTAFAKLGEYTSPI